MATTLSERSFASGGRSWWDNPEIYGGTAGEEPLAAVRSDTLPENTAYRDEGCELSPSCLRCPLPVCKYDDPGWIRRVNRITRDRAVIKVRQRDGLSVQSLSERFRISTRTVHRILKNKRSGSLDREQASPVAPQLQALEGSSFREPTPLPLIRPSKVSDERAAVGEERSAYRAEDSIAA